MTIKQLEEIGYRCLAKRARSLSDFPGDYTTHLGSLFNWSETEEGSDFWRCVNKGHFSKAKSILYRIGELDIANRYFPFLVADSTSQVNMCGDRYFEYRPLKDIFEVRNSNIDGQGLFLAITELKPHDINPVMVVKNELELYELITHYVVDGDVIRTPIGGFINHSSSPNCTLVKLSEAMSKFDAVYYLKPLRRIISGEEITIDYDVHTMCGKN